VAIIKPDERVFIAGKTGSGKTYLAERLLDDFPFVVVLDNKGLFGTDRNTKEFYLARKGYGLCYSLDELPEFAKKYKKIVYRPDPILEGNRKEFLDEMDAFMWWIYNRENCILYVDESTAVTDSSNILPGHNAIMKRGREKNIGCWNSSQQPVNVHNTLISEAEHIFAFRTQLQGHRDKLAGFMGDIVRQQIPGQLKYHYYYFNPETMDDAVLSTPIE
jgi:hypothetical protein